MLTQKCFEAYAASGLDGSLGVLMPNGDSVIFEDDTTYVPESNETEEQILDRIERSKKAGRNLFKEEWELWEPDPNLDY